MNEETVLQAHERAVQDAAWTLIRGLIDGDPTGTMQEKAAAWLINN